MARIWPPSRPSAPEPGDRPRKRHERRGQGRRDVRAWLAIGGALLAVLVVGGMVGATLTAAWCPCWP